jgi:hypothetical protein
MKSMEECRIQSVQCREKAQQASNEFLRRSLNDAADMWLQLMVEALAREALNSPVERS